MGGGAVLVKPGRLLPFALAAVAVVIVAVLVVSHAPSGGGGSSDLQLLAEKLSRLDGISAVRVVTGEEAVRLVTGIHFDPHAFHPRDAVIILYSDGSRLWVTRVDDACDLVERMAERMRVLADRLPYTAPRAERVDGTTFYVSLDKRDGSVHIFWCEPRSELAVWLEARSSEMLREGLHEIIRVLGEPG